jgi:D-ribose pyranase
MKKAGVLNDRLSYAIARMGHMDMLTVGDAGLPIPQSVERIDLALVAGVPGFLTVVGAIAAELEVQEIILAEEIKIHNPDVEAGLKALFKGVEVVYIPHSELKVLCVGSKAIVRTGETTPYANVILVSGVTF